MTFVHCLYWRKMEDKNGDGVRFEVYQGAISETTSGAVFYHGTSISKAQSCHDVLPTTSANAFERWRPHAHAPSDAVLTEQNQVPNETGCILHSAPPTSNVCPLSLENCPEAQFRQTACALWNWRYLPRRCDGDLEARWLQSIRSSSPWWS